MGKGDKEKEEGRLKGRIKQEKKTGKRRREGVERE
jgi:hypothetical protein